MNGQAGTGYNRTMLRHFVTTLFLAAALTALPLQAEEGTLADGARKAGHAAGSAAHQVGQGTKKIGKTIGKEAKKVGKTIGHAAAEGGREFRRAVRGKGKNQGS